MSVVGSAGLFADLPVKATKSTRQGAVTVAPVEWSWSAMKIRFVGKAWPQTPEEGFAAVEKRAFAAGLEGMVQDMQRQYPDYLKSAQIQEASSPQSAVQAAKRVSRGAYVQHTEYFGDGSVRLSMESHLPSAFIGLFSFSIEKAGSTKGIAPTGVALRSAVYIPPMPVYEVVDEGGQVLFGVKQVAKDAYQKNLMGRWLTKSASGNIEGLFRAVGAKSISIEIQAVTGNKLQVNGAKWREALGQSQALLENAKIAVVTPRGPSA